jgi:hypothetical protein
MWNKTVVAILTLGTIGAVAAVAWSDEDDASGAALAKYLPTAKVTLQQGLTAAESQGKPISGKFEVDEGHFQLSVYTAQDGKFSEVLIDHNTGKVAKTEAITEGDDYADAKKQIEACGKSKTSLKAAVDRAEQANGGYRAVSVIPSMRNGHPIAIVSLLHGTQVKSVSEPLD